VRCYLLLAPRRKPSLATRRRKRPPEAADICKPCWELLYCPYGRLVEMFPLPARPAKALRVLAPEDAREARALLTRKGREANFKRLEGLMLEEGVKTAEDAWHWAEVLSANDPDWHEYVQQFDLQDISCSIFGHCCPVFITSSGATETKLRRQWGPYIPRAVLLKVLRRDNYTCQKCYKHVEDDDIHLDHIIPKSRGGPTSAGNLRLLCSACNQRKSNSLEELLVDHAAEAIERASEGLDRLREAIPSASPEQTNELRRIARDIIRRIDVMADDPMEKARHRKASRALLAAAEGLMPGILAEAARPEWELTGSTSPRKVALAKSSRRSSS
jgi:hypothetical protein